MAQMGWVYDPQSGGVKITVSKQADFHNRVDQFSGTRPWFPKYKLKLRFKNQFCYLDSLEEGETTAFPLCRLRYFRDNIWSMAFYTYSNNRYEPCIFQNGTWEGSIEEAIEICEMYLS